MRTISFFFPFYFNCFFLQCSFRGSVPCDCFLFSLMREAPSPWRTRSRQQQTWDAWRPHLIKKKKQQTLHKMENMDVQQLFAMNYLWETLNTCAVFAQEPDAASAWKPTSAWWRCKLSRPSNQVPEAKWHLITEKQIPFLSRQVCTGQTTADTEMSSPAGCFAALGRAWKLSVGG